MTDNELKHYGKGHLDGGHSGRWPWGSKKNKGITNNTKKISDFSDDELRSLVTRLRLEKDYYDTKKAVSAYTAPKPSAVQRFIKSVGTDVVLPALQTAAKDSLTKFLKQKAYKVLQLPPDQQKKKKDDADQEKKEDDNK